MMGLIQVQRTGIAVVRGANREQEDLKEGCRSWLNEVDKWFELQLMGRPQGLPA